MSKILKEIERERVNSPCRIGSFAKVKPALFLFAGFLVLGFFLFSPKFAHAANATSTQSGLWSATSTWVGGVVPGNGDTAVISNNHIVTVDTDTIIGTSGVAGTTAINLNASGQVIIAAGKTLVVRGDILYTAGSSNKTPGIVLASATYPSAVGGAVLEFDSSQAADPTGTKYSYKQSAASGFRHIVSHGTAANRNIIRANLAGGAGYIARDYSWGGGLIATYTQFIHMGDATTDFAKPEYNGTNVTWDVRWSVFGGPTETERSGRIYAPNWDAYSEAGTIFRHDYNYHYPTVGNVAALKVSNSGSSSKNATAIREIIGNVFKGTSFVALPNDTTSQMRDFTITDNYFGQSYGINNSNTTNLPSAFTRNLIRQTTAGSVPFPAATTNANYWLADYSGINPHGLQNGVAGDWTISNHIFEFADIDSQGDAILGTTPSALMRIFIDNLLVLPTAAGRSAGALTFFGNPNVQFSVEHVTAPCPEYGLLNIELTQGIAGSVLLLRNNIVWKPWGDGPYCFKFADPANFPQYGGTEGAAIEDLIAPSNADYNGGWQFTETYPSATYNTNQGNGYASKWSVTPGAHDVTANPQFVDYTRKTPNFDQRYLGRTAATAWQTGTPYAVGNLVSEANNSYWQGERINYRAIRAHTSDASTQPMIGSATQANGLLVSVNTAANVTTVVTTNPHGYAVGDPVSMENSTVIVAGKLSAGCFVATVPNATTFTCSTPTVPNGNYTADTQLHLWRHYWEYNSLYEIRQAMATNASRTYNTDITIGCGSGCAPIETLYNWIKQGYAPQNRALMTAAHDGTTIGAVAWVDYYPTTVSVSSPAASATISGTQTITATASDSSGITGVKFYYDTTNLIGAEDTSSPYSVSLDTTSVSNGSHTLIAVATDTYGNTATSTAVTVTVTNGSSGSGSGYRSPAAPPAVTALAAVPGDSQVALSWVNPTASAAWLKTTIMRKTAHAPVSVLDGALVYSGTAASYVDTGLTNGVTYYYSAFALNSASDPAVTTAFATPLGVSGSETPLANPTTTPPAASVPPGQPDSTVSPGPASASSSRLVKYSDSPTVYRLENGGTLSPLSSWEMYVANFFDLPIATLPQTETYPTGKTARFNSGTLLKSSGDPTVYLVLSDGSRYGFAAMAEFLRFGYRFGQVVEVPAAELAQHALSDLRNLVSHPDGQFVKYPDSPTVYRMENGAKRPLPSFSIFTAYADPAAILTIPRDFSYPDGPALGFPDGLLVRGRSQATVYLIAAGQRRAIASPEALNRLGYALGQVLTVADADLEFNARGEDIQ